MPVKQRVLLIDDSTASRASLTEALRRQGFDVVAVGDLEALDLALGRAKPDVLIVDVHMPDVFGNDLVPWLRENRLVDRPILLYSNQSPYELKALADECGADGWLHKTGRPDEVAAHVERFLTGGEG